MRQEVVIIPEALKQLNLHRVQQVGESSVVSYRNDRGEQTARVLNTHLSVIHVRQGTKRISSGQERVEVSAPGLVVCRPGVHVMTEFLPGENHAFQSTVFFFGRDLLINLGREYPELAVASGVAHKLYAQGLADDQELRTLLEHIPDLFPRLHDPRLMALKLRELVLWLGQSGAGDVLREEVYEACADPDVRMRAMIESNAERAATLEELAVLTGRSLSAFKRDFGRLYDEAPGRWLRARRLAQSRQLLSRGTHNVTEASLSVGFGNLSHFIRAFKSEFGVTPKQYQRQATRPRQA